MKFDLSKSIYFNIKNKITGNWMSVFRIVIVIDMLIKTTLFLAILEEKKADRLIMSNISTKLSLVHLMYIILIFSFGYLLSYNKQVIYYNLLNIVYSILLVMDLGYYRVNMDVLGLKNIFFPGTFNIMNGHIFVFKLIDMIFLIDIILIILWVVICRVGNSEKRSLIKFSATFIVSILGIFISYIALDGLKLAGWDRLMFDKGWTTLMSIRAPGPIGYHGYEAVTTLKKVLHRPKEEEMKEIDEWLLNNDENLPDNEYKGIYKGKNVIFLQIESLENFVIKQKTNGKEITPNLNRLIKEGLYFNNIYEQNNAGNSIDCDYIVHSSVFPLGDKITALNYGEVAYPNSLQRVLNNEGYKTISTHQLDNGEFNWAELHGNGFGATELWGEDDFIYDDYVGYGLSDESFYNQLVDKIDTVEEPFYIHAATLSSHGPFDIADEYRELDLPEEIDESYLGGYFESVRYADEQIGTLIDKLDEKGLLDDTMLVIYGDHGGVHKYYNDDIKDLSYEGDWWKEYTKEIPLIIYSKDGVQGEFNAHGGQVDIMPTVSYLLGVDDSNYKKTSMGRVLVNTNRDATVIKGNIIKGEYKDEEEKEHLLKAYDIGRMIIENNYFKYNRNNSNLSVEE